MTMFEAWTIWSDNQPDRVAEGLAKRECKERPAPTLMQLNESVLHDIGMSRFGFPVRQH